MTLPLLTALQTLGAAPLLVRKWRRFWRRRDSYEWTPQRWNGRWIVPPSPQWSTATGPHLAFFADGFAETRMAARLMQILAAKRPDWRFSLVIRNLQDARDGHAIPPGVPVSALPFDYFPAVKSWFRAVSPDGIVMVEKLFYPNFVRGSAALGARVVGVNSYARPSDCRQNPQFKAWILGGFSAIGLRSEEQLEHLTPILGRVPTQITGSLKFPAPRARSETKLGAELNDWLDSARNRPILAAGSVEDGETAVLCEAFTRLRQKTEAVLLWAPRHVETADALALQLAKRGWNVWRRSQFSLSNDAADVLLLDTMGELSACYARCEGAFVGGTFAGGGHNVLEPLGWGIPVVFGPKLGFFAAEQTMCVENGVGVAVQDAAELAAHWERMLEDEHWRLEVCARIAAFVGEGQKSWDATVAWLVAQFEAIG